MSSPDSGLKNRSGQPAQRHFMSVFLTSVRSESFERHRLLVVIVFILPDVVSALCAAPAAVAEVGHDHTLLLSQKHLSPALARCALGGARKIKLRHTHRNFRRPQTSARC